MTIILTSILPVCFIVALGAVLAVRKFLPVIFFEQLNRLGFYVLLPALLFHKIAAADTGSVGPALWIGALLCGCSIIITFAALAWGHLARLPGPSTRSLMQAAMRGNLAYSGMPIVLFIFGADSAIAVPAVLSLILAVPFYNFLAVTILTPPEGSTFGKRLKRTVTGIVTNPLIIACMLGLACMLLHLHIPAPIMRTCQTVGQAALPCALLSLGAGLSFDTIKLQLKPALAATILKVVLMPIIGYLILMMKKDLDGAVLLTALIYLASPTAVTSYLMAEQMGADKDLAAAAITLSTICSMPVLAIILLLFG